ncbi:39S ribosomal protein L13, mitochondrial isoform X3 [Pipra filicauda]|uniref:Large ribosomal subunit protein uL13m n=1 Tax=Pipra filicauda TaxID=649802 RepID=A0A7R5KCH0_9PASS|nr:39S ribosomal protein L13, mitochondrial isoform X3 [Pipra filicauda]
MAGKGPGQERGRGRGRSEGPALPPGRRPSQGSASASRGRGGPGAPGPRRGMASYTKAAQQWATFGRAWYLLDAKMQPPGKIAAATVMRLEGKHKPIYHALNDCGDHVVIINTRHIAFSGNKWEQKVYSSHTGYPGGFKQVTATQLHLKDPTAGHRMVQVEGSLRKSLVQSPTQSNVGYYVT